MDEPQAASPRAHRAGGREAKRAARSARAGISMPYITRRIGVYEVLDEEGLATIERNADIILAEIGIEYRDDPEALAVWKAAGADIDGERVRCPPGMCRSIVQASAPRDFIQHARNPARSVPIGGKHTVFAPVVRVALRAQPRRGPPLRDHRGLPQLRQARLHGAVAASLRRHDLRAGRPAREQAALRHGVQPHEVQRQAVHGLGDAPGARAGLGRDGEDPVRRRVRRSGYGQAADGDHQPDQRELADDLRRHDARRREGLRARQSGDASSRRSSSPARCRRSRWPAPPRRRWPRRCRAWRSCS